MSWVCPNCSTSNDDEHANCFVCGMEQPTSTIVSTPDTDDIKVVFSDFEAFKESVKKLFGHKPDSVDLIEADETRSARTDKTPKALKTKRKITKKSKPRKVKLFDSEFAKPWPEHEIKFDPEAIRAKGYVRSEQTCLGDINGYSFYKEDGSSQFIRLEMLLVQKLAHKV